MSLHPPSNFICGGSTVPEVKAAEAQLFKQPILFLTLYLPSAEYTSHDSLPYAMAHALHLLVLVGT